MISEEFNSLFFRNAVNTGLPAMTIPDATTVLHEGDTASFDLAEGSWRNDTTAATGTVPRLPQMLLDIVDGGGVMSRLAAQGYLPASADDSASLGSPAATA